ncbi:transposase [Leuconostoc citreum]|uniref:transposase n=1 Tax=Leuconostoc citreum TaxID=33964 RepID=UPI0032DFD034
MGQLSAPAVAYNSYNVAQVVYYAKRLLELHETKKSIMTAMVDKAKYLPEYSIYQSIPGFSDKTVVSLIAKLGDLHRFRTANQLNAFVGIDLRFNDSGDYKSTGFITKRGNSTARQVLFKAVSNIASTASYGHPSHINDWYQKKKQYSMSMGTKKIAIGAM